MLLDGYPGRDILLARRKADDWYVGGLNAEDRKKIQILKLDFLEEDDQYRLILISDGEHDKDFNTEYLVVDNRDTIEVEVLPRGGFVALIKLLK
jgi:hypothetical protein